MGNRCEILDNLFCILCLSGSRLARDQDALVLVLVDEVPKRFVGNGKNVRFGVFPAPALVHVDVLVRVDRKGAVGVDCHEKQSRVGVYEVGHVSCVQVVDNRGLVQVRQLCHVVRFVELGRVDFIDALAVDLSLASIVALDQNPVSSKFLHNPTLDKSCLGVLKPHVFFAREVILALDSPNCVGALQNVLRLDERGRKCVGARGGPSRAFARWRSAYRRGWCKCCGDRRVRLRSGVRGQDRD
ncbi:hypothetical protein B0T26DRAFT_729656 [Lasiosphaeria miniovina]|uniref:Uncharacterized protein n=1 Tax=Lasiosphaeria miniovina TaxID=1954250 RepID=A0AA40DKD3_9PEZI|nr:uncharacterized protein B0T26DRAFT_729656 [Lasiosphaeria miniovina]KAK0703038.1 hypothetical protein B0T26DRAFT_729656 [Lasiosphaeria miniovina]